MMQRVWRHNLWTMGWRAVSFAIVFLRMVVWQGGSSDHSSLVNAQPPAGNQGPPRMVDVLVGFDQVPGASERRLIHAHGGRVNKEFWLVPAVAATLPEPAVDALRKACGVRVVEPDGLFHAIDHTEKEGENPELDYAWGVKHIGTGPVHNTNRTGRSKADVREDGNEDGNEDVPVKGVPVRVAIIDSGISPHQDLATIAGGWNFINNRDNFHDDTNHGTHVAGTVAAIYNGYGVVGVAPEVDLYAAKTLGPNGGSFSSVIAALQWCPEKGIQVTNNSYGSSADPGTIVQDAFDNSSALGIVHIAAAGNSGRVSGNNNSVQWPARYESVIAVAVTARLIPVTTRLVLRNL